MQIIITRWSQKIYRGQNLKSFFGSKAWTHVALRTNACHFSCNQGFEVVVLLNHQ